MTVEYALRLLGQLDTVITMLTSAANEAVRAEKEWLENGDGTVATLWTDAQKAAFVDTLEHTHTIRAALLAREVSAE